LYRTSFSALIFQKIAVTPKMTVNMMAVLAFQL
jgi:hypothetical protein